MAVDHPENEPTRCVPGLVSACLVTFRPSPDLGSCLAALLAQTHRPLELVVVDNGGDSGVAAEVRRSPLLGRHILNPSNRGFAAGMNQAIAAASGEFILTLNPDVVLSPGFAALAVSLLSADPTVAAAAARLLRLDDAAAGTPERLDSAGVRLGLVRRAKDRGAGEPAAGRYEEEEDVDAACAAAAMFRRVALDLARHEDGAWLDESFFAYKEDVDLCWRLRRKGFRIRYTPRLVAWHRRGWRPGARRQVPVEVRRHSLKNRILMIVKNESALSLVLRFPLLVAQELLVFLYAALREPEILPGYASVFRHLPLAVLRRREGRRS